MYPETTRGPEISINITSWIQVPLKLIIKIWKIRSVKHLQIGQPPKKKIKTAGLILEESERLGT